MKFKSYLNESVRMDEIDEDTLLLKLHLHCKKNLNYFLNSQRVFRGTHNEGSFYQGDSNKGEPRESANTRNYYTLMIDNSKYGKDYPKRSKSFICATYEAAYGNLYYVIPYDGTKIGVCPQDDMGESFYETLNRRSLNQFNNGLYDTFRLETRYNTGNDLKKDLNEKSDKLRKNNSMDFFDFMEKFPIFEPGNKSSNMNFTDYGEEIFDPKKNYFRIYDNINNLGKQREVWFSGKAIFIEVERYDHDFELKKKIIDVNKGKV